MGNAKASYDGILPVSRNCRHKRKTKKNAQGALWRETGVSFRVFFFFEALPSLCRRFERPLSLLHPTQAPSSLSTSLPQNKTGPLFLPRPTVSMQMCLEREWIGEVSKWREGTRAGCCQRTDARQFFFPSLFRSFSLFFARHLASPLVGALLFSLSLSFLSKISFSSFNSPRQKKKTRNK